MFYTIKLTYNDGHVLDVNIPESEYESFMKSVKTLEVFWDAKQVQGFWTNVGNIRYMQLIKSGEDEIMSAGDVSEDTIGDEPKVEGDFDGESEAADSSEVPS